MALSGRHQGKRVIALRGEYENIFIGLIDDLPLRKGVDRRYLRLTVIGALSWSLFWFKKERDTPAAIAKQILSMLRAGIEDAKYVMGLERARNVWAFRHGNSYCRSDWHRACGKM